jgi:DNA-binding Lrp family transcriptional regulator
VLTSRGNRYPVGAEEPDPELITRPVSDTEPSPNATAPADTIAAFEDASAAVPEIRHAERLFGDPDSLLRVVAIDLNDYTTLRDQKLATLPGIHRISSTIVMKRIVDNRPLPLMASRSRRARGIATTSHRQRSTSRPRRG